jgi:predicted regulator of Ras-like GTPase activity (Roadblock/LC7/MglB family)
MDEINALKSGAGVDKENEDKGKAEAEARQKAEEEADRKAREEADRKAKEDADRKAKEDADRKAKEDADRKAKEDADRKAKEDARHGGRGSDKFTPEDILSVIAGSAEDLIENDATAAKPPKAPGAGPAASGLIQAFLQAQSIEASLLLDAKGKVLEYKVDGDPVLLGQVAGAVFQSAERAAKNVGLGGLKQVMISCEGNRQILFLGLSAGVLVAVTGKDTNVGQLRVAVHDLMKRA